MNWTVDTPIRTGPYACAAIVEVDISVRAAGPALTAYGVKRPIMVIIMRDRAIRGMDAKGHHYDQNEIEFLYPKAIKKMTTLLNEAQ